MPAEEPSIEDYLRWLSDEIFDLPDMFSGVNENFATAAIEGAFAMASDSIDPDVVWGVATVGGVDVLPIGSDVRRVTWAVSMKWWRLFGYNYVLTIIRARRDDVFVYFDVLLWPGDSYPIVAFS
jgi:hypothetical protein